MAALNFVEAGRVLDTSIYPVKGMQGVSLNEIVLRSVSVAGDRTRAFARTDTNQTPNFLDTTQFPGLLQYSPELVSPLDPRRSEVVVFTPEGHKYSADSNELLHEVSEKSGHKLTIVRMGRGAYHSMPVSLLSKESISAIEAASGFPLDTRRFRENVIVETKEGNPYEEDAWIGKLVKFGDSKDAAIIAGVKLDPRCSTVNMNPETGEQTPEVLKAIVKERGNSVPLGIYATVVFEGKIRRGDTIYVASFR